MKSSIPEATPARLLGFGLIMLAGLSALGAWLHSFVPVALGVVVLVLTPVRPVSVRLYRAWMTLGLLMSRVTSPVVLLIIFLLVITPIALLSRLFRRDPLRLRPQPDESYWEDRSPRGDAASYLRQY